MAEIKISELSIGDWVRYESTVITLPMKVLEIGEKDTICDGQIYITGETEAGRMFCETTELKPIPLTPEILEKNGISKTYESDEYAVYKGEGFNVTEYYTELWEFEKHRNRLMIRNVHQLQHALRLAGVEKEIEV